MGGSCQGSAKRLIAVIDLRNGWSNFAPNYEAMLKEKIAQSMPDLVLMDMNLPIRNGWSTCRALRANEATASLPIIALTAHAMAGDEQKALDAGCDDYATKPIDFPLLLAKIDKLLA